MPLETQYQCVWGELDVELFRAAVEADCRHGRDGPLSLIWRELTGGTARGVGAFCHDERAYVILEQRNAPPTRTNPTSFEVLRRTLRGEAQKSISADLELTPSAISLASSRALEQMGFVGTARQAPALLVLAAHSTTAHGRALLGRTSLLAYGERLRRVVSAPLPEAAPRALLSSSERVVTRLVLQGMGNAEIATLRGTATSTVRNQLASVSTKLRAAGRFGLFRSLLEDD